MKTRTKPQALVTLGATALLVGGIGIASASGRDDARLGAAAAATAGKALARHQPAAAIAAAEEAVEHGAANADYRLLLGQSYLAAGRFASARAAFADAVALNPSGPALFKAALNLSLMQIATGDWAGARATLAAHSAGIAPADRGLATALAGDPAGAVAMLTEAARAGDVTPKVRQNLALSLALAGQWPAARAVAAVDLSPADLDKRMEQWAAFARPTGAADQVATLLGVTPVADAGEPARLALGGGEPSVTMAAASAPAPVVAAPVSAPVAAVPVAVTPSPAPVAALPVAAVAVPPQAGAAPGFVAARIVFGPRREVVQAVPAVANAPVIQPGRAPVKVALAAPAVQPSARGGYVVQLGAFESSAVARDAWGRATRRMPALAQRGASGMTVAFKGAHLYRLSVTGFARGDADALCRRYRQAGGACFVRAGAGDQIAAWARPAKPVQVASK